MQNSFTFFGQNAVRSLSLYCKPITNSIKRQPAYILLQPSNIYFIVCSAKADIGILIDGSSTVNQEKFSKLLDFTKSLVGSFSVSEDRTHIAVATASRGPHMSFDFQGFHDIPSLNTAISRTAYLGGPFLLGENIYFF